MAQYGSGPGREHGRLPASVRIEDPMPDGIDPPMYDVQSTQLDPVIDRVTPDPLFNQLRACHDAVLAFRKLCDRPVNRFRPQLTGYDAANCGLISHGY
jgi:hypothetical protein